MESAISSPHQAGQGQWRGNHRGPQEKGPGEECDVETQAQGKGEAKSEIGTPGKVLCLSNTQFLLP